ncbi:TRAP transporter large permease [Aliagarivorans taiwanensis]|uniref:TRAP transporter large permease n=1 Tax=Aliagarivorans taiwanensis TaxID=561966 RepID=UPI0003FBE1EB|nr:TRAP transporter large permease [Aliagarivorans taiwanensis]
MILTVVLCFFVLLLTGMPIGFILGIAGVVGLYGIGGDYMMVMGAKRFFEGLDLFTFMAMPFFILAGEIMNRSGITVRLIQFAEALVGYLRGGLAQSNMLASVLFAGMTGAAVSDAAAFGNTLVPAMVKKGYNRPFACAVTAAGSIIGPTIPPSNLMVIYGSLMGVSISGLFAAGIIPGLLIAVTCMAMIAAFGRRWKLPKDKRGPSLRHILSSFRSSLLAIIMPVIILGSILAGITTPTEAAAVAVAYALFVGTVIYRNISPKDLLDMLVRTAKITGVVFLIIASASIVGWWMTFNQIPQMIADLFLGISSDPAIITLLILLMLITIGMFMDINAVLIILAPVLVPLTTAIGMDPIHAGIMIILALNISLMTPPVGACLFVLSSVTGEKVEKISVALWPFLLVQLTVLILIAFWSGLTLTIPRYLGF